MTWMTGVQSKVNIRLNFFNSLSLFIISAAVIALQVIFMRSLSITRYHHFSYLVISTALLGFGASGTFLTFVCRKITARYSFWSWFFIFLFALSIPCCSILSEKLPIDMQYLLFSWRQVLLLMVYNLLLFVPFFLAGTIIGLALMFFQENVPIVYGINLFGSGAGGLMAVVLLMNIPAFSLPQVVSAMLFIALILWLLSSREYFVVTFVTTSALILISVVGSLFLLSYQPMVRPDQYKMISHLGRLEKQSDARKLVTRFSPRAQIDVYDSEHLHYTLFAGLNADTLPPRQMAILIDGNFAGGIFKISSSEQAGILDFTPQSLAYRLTESPRVLLLGETGGINVWLAKRFGAPKITVVQGNEQLNRIMMNELAGESGNIYGGPDVEVISKEPHLFIRQAGDSFDIIQIVSAEGPSAGVSGLQSLHEDYLLTVESIAQCYRLLSDNGFITLTRGIQVPPRDNLKIFSLFAEALGELGTEHIEDHLLQARNYLAVTTMISKRPLDDGTIARFRAYSRQLLMDAEYYRGIRSEAIDQVNVMAGPEGEPFSYLHFGDMKILSPERDNFVRAWAYNISPPRDNKPYFYDFFKWKSLGNFIGSYGKYWFQRLELGYVILVIAFVETTAVALLLIVLPLFWLKSGPGGKGGGLASAVYFLSLGFGFMFIEMIAIQKFTKFMGDPIYSITAVLTSILFFAGLGSLLQKRLVAPLIRRIRFSAGAISLIVVFYLVYLERILSLFINYDILGRFLISAALLAPLSFFMGWMFPNGMTILEKGKKSIIPWAWGVNGFASVSAAPLSVMLSMSMGFRGVLVIAVLFYLMAAFFAQFIERKGGNSGDCN